MKSKRIYLKAIFIFFVFLVFIPINLSAKGKNIHFVTVQWEPYYGPNLLNQGYIAEITRAALKRVGYSMDIEFVPWKRALHDAKNGYYNGVLGLYYSGERASWLTYSESVSSVGLVFFVKKDNKISWNSLQDLKPYRIGIERGFVYTEEFDNSNFLHKEPVRNVELNLKKLLEGRIDMVAASRNVFLHWIKTRHPGKLDLVEVVPKPLVENKIYNGFTKADPNHTNYVKDFNKGLELIKQDGTYRQILEKHGFK
jgi:polar amino acid transport system substrate-binding protein